MRERFIADVHLDPDRPAVTAAFLRCLDDAARTCSGLWLLGDIFEVWIGDDDDDPFVATLLAALRATCAAIPVRLLHGNRDFLVGAGFSARTGVQRVDDGHVLDLAGRRTVLLHGDVLCTGDHAYQAFRALTRGAAWQQDMLARPLAERRTIGAALRARSIADSAGKPSAIMDVHPDAVAAAFAASGADEMIHGHVHRPACHPGPRPSTRRWVLGDWGRCAWWLDWTPQGGALTCTATAG